MSYSYRVFHEGDELSIEELLKITFPKFKEQNLWYWKYKLNPNFNGSLVFLAEKNGEIVGTNYWLLREIKLLNNLQIKAALGADIAVNPKHRGQGVGKELIRYPRLSGTFKENRIILSYIFGKPELSKQLYEPAAGYITAPNCTVTYRKLFNCQQLDQKFQEINRKIQSDAELKGKLANFTISIFFKLQGAPEFSIIVKPEKISLIEGMVEKPNIAIVGSLPLSSLFINGGMKTLDLVKAWLTGKVKFKKGWRHVFKLRSLFRLFQMALKKKQ